MGYVTWLAIMFLTGVLTLVSPVFVGPLLPASRRRALSDRYFKMAASAAQRLILVRRKLGGYSLLPSSYDSEKEAEAVKLGGEKKHFDDPHRYMSRMHARPFGLAFERSAAIITPLIAEVGRRFSTWLEDDEHKIPIEQETEAGEVRTITAFNRTLAIPETSSLVDPAHVMNVLPGSARPSIAETGYEYARKSQEGFNTRRAMEAISIVIGFCAGFGIVFLAMREIGGGGGAASGVNLPMLVGVLL